MKTNKEIAVIKLSSPNGETMIWKTSISHVSNNKVRYLDIAKRNFAHDLVNKYWLLKGKAIKLEYEDTYIIRPIANSKEELFNKKALMKKEIIDLSNKIIAKRIYYKPNKS